MTLPSFRIMGLDAQLFEPLFALTDRALAERGMRRLVADAEPGYPCRVSLQDAAVGDELLLLPFEHHAAPGPYRASGPLFVRRGVTTARLAPGAVPPVVTRRLISLRAYDAQHDMLMAEVLPGSDVAGQLAAWFQRPEVQLVQLHNAKQGCFSCSALRA